MTAWPQPTVPLERRGERRRLTGVTWSVAAFLLVLATELAGQTSPTLVNPYGSGDPSLRSAGALNTATPIALDPAVVAAPSKPASRISLKTLLPKGNLAQSSLAAYLQRVKAETQVTKAGDGAIWTENGRLARFSTDMRAMRPNDLISVVVQENLAASTDGSVKNSRASSASSQVTSLIGALKSGNALQKLLGQSSSLALNAAGASATNSSLTTTFGGQVVDVLPNGTLVIEAARQVEFSQQTQTIVLRGLVRPEDISQENQVLSTAISSLELEVKGKGIVNDSTYRQNPLVRLIEHLLVF